MVRGVQLNLSHKTRLRGGNRTNLVNINFMYLFVKKILRELNAKKNLVN